jgi:circadian clock protein KaiB
MKTKSTSGKKLGAKSASRPAVEKKAKPSAESYMMRLYVAGQSTRSVAAIANLRRLCDTHMPGCTIEIIDLMRNPELAKVDGIVAIPTLIKKLPTPVKRIIGDLSAAEKVLLGLELTST